MRFFVVSGKFQKLNQVKSKKLKRPGKGPRQERPKRKQIHCRTNLSSPSVTFHVKHQQPFFETKKKREKEEKDREGNFQKRKSLDPKEKK